MTRDGRLCIWPNENCRCVECATPLGAGLYAPPAPYTDRSDAPDDEFTRAVAPFYDVDEPRIDSQWDRED